MELPKNITQIGEADRHCKVYAEDYVISYIKQMNRQAENHNIAVALYGIRKEEDQVSYLFLYGAGKVNSIEKEVRHLSQAQLQEIDRLRKRYFPEYKFLGYRIMNGEMVEGFHICEQGNCRYVKGYACFYEKNDTMLAYMLDSRKEEAAPEVVDQEKYEKVRQRQEERRARYRNEQEESAEETYSGNTVNASYGRAQRRTARAVQTGRKATRVKVVKGSESALKRMKLAAVGMFLLLCILGVATLSDSYQWESIQTAAGRLIAEFKEQKIPDSEQEQDAVGQNSTLVAEDKLTEAIRQENSATQETESIEETKETEESTQDSAEEANQPEQQPMEESAQQPSQEPSQEPSPESSQEPDVPASAPVAYTIQKGDTLTGICLKIYGTDAKVQEICEYNGIKNPDSIKYGQKIMLP